MKAVQLWFCTLLLGPAVGSFCGLLLTRLPRRRSALTPASHCFACRHPLTAPDLVPLLSFLWLRGRCRYCGAAIPRQHLAAELGCTAAACTGAALGAWWGLALALLAAAGGLAAWGIVHPSPSSERGSSLLEVVAAAALLAFALVPVLGMLTGAGSASVSARRRAAYTTFALAKLEQCRSQGYYNLMAQVGGSGTCNGSETGLPDWPDLIRTTSVQARDPSGSGAPVILLQVTVGPAAAPPGRASTLTTLVGEGG